MSSFLVTSYYNVITSLTSVLCTDNRSKRSETRQNNNVFSSENEI